MASKPEIDLQPIQDYSDVVRFVPAIIIFSAFSILAIALIASH